MSEKTPRKRRWLKPLLGLSLAANLLVVGMAAGAFWRFKDVDGRKMRGGPSGLVYMRALDPSDRKAIFEDVRTQRDASRTATREQHQLMLTALRADPFDGGQVKDILAEQSAQGLGARAIVEAKWLDVVSQMSDEDRASYADRLEQSLNRHGKKRTRPQAD